MVWQGGAPRCFGPGRSVAYAAAGTDASLARAGRRRPHRAKLARQETIGSATAMTGSPPTPPAGKVAALARRRRRLGPPLPLLSAPPGMTLGNARAACGGTGGQDVGSSRVAAASKKKKTQN